MSFLYNAISAGIGYVAARVGYSPEEAATAATNPAVQNSALNAAETAATAAAATAAATGNPGEQNAGLAAAQTAAAARNALANGLPPVPTGSPLPVSTNSAAIGIAIVQGVTSDPSVQQAVLNSNSSASSQYESVKNRTRRIEAEKARRIEAEAELRRPTTTGSAVASGLRTGQTQQAAAQAALARNQAWKEKNARKIQHVSPEQMGSVYALSSGELSRGSPVEAMRQEIRALRSTIEDINNSIKDAEESLRTLGNIGKDEKKRQEKEDLELEIKHNIELRKEINDKINKLTMQLPTNGGTRRHRRNHRKTRYRR